MEALQALDRTATGTVWRVAARPGRVMWAAALALLLALTASPGLVTASPGADAERTWIVDVGTVLPAAAEIIGSLPMADALIVSSPIAISGAAAFDAPVRPESLVFDDDGGSLDSGVATTGAPQVWDTTRGERAVVALIDTGVAPVGALEGAVAGEIDFSGTGGGDDFGHGTFLASIIAGRDQAALGVAPGAGILSLKVGGPDGSATLGAVMSALQWLHGPGRSAGIRVATLALAVEPGTEAAGFLDRSVERLAGAGVLVVTAAGNDGPDALTSPATAAGSFAVGAIDDAGTADRSDDSPTGFSGSGPDAHGVMQPDAMASGVEVVGTLPAGSAIAEGATPLGDSDLYAGSGTSMSTALASGVAALASSARPDLGGAALDAALRAGGGVVDAPSALAAVLAQDQTPGRSGTAGPGNSDNGSGNGAGSGGNGNGSADPQSIRWASIRWASIRWAGDGWGDTSWTMQGWGSIRWAGTHWAFDGPVDPQSIRWASIRWASIRWAWVQ